MAVAISPGTISISRAKAPAFANIRNRDYFKEAISENIEKARLRRPIIARLTGRWGIPISLKLPSDAAGFRFVVVAVDVGRLLAVQENWRISRHGCIVLMREDGTLLSRTPFGKDLLGNKFTGGQAYKERQGNPTGTYLTNSTTTDGIKHIVSYEYLDDLHLFIIVTRGYDEALYAFYKIRTYASISVAILTLFILVAALATHRAQKALLKVQQSYQHLALVDELTTVMNRRAFNGKAAWRKHRDTHY